MGQNTKQKIQKSKAEPLEMALTQSLKTGISLTTPFLFCFPILIDPFLSERVCS